MYRGIRFGSVFCFLLICLVNIYSLESRDIFDIAANGTVSEMNRCLNNGININSLNAKGYSPVMFATLHDNYEVFQYLVNKNAKLDIITTNGCNIQILLGYFSFENFQKACSLLNDNQINLDAPSKINMSLLHYLVFSCDYDKVKYFLKYKPDLFRKETISDSLPIDMLQYSSYEYTDISSLSDKKKHDLVEIERLLIENGSPVINYSPLTIGRFGNFLFVHFKIISQLIPNISLDQINLSKYYLFYNNGNQKIARLDIDKISDMYKNVGLKAEIIVYKENFQKILKQCEESPDPYFLIVNVGNCPLISQNWINVSGLENGSEYLLKNDSDIRFELFDYQLDDINTLITIRILK
jgi:ankyrin repeat protein